MKKFLVVTTGILFLGFSVVSILIATIDANQYKAGLISAVEEITGRDFDINGDISVKLSVIPTLSAEGVSFGNAGWATSTTMASVEQFEARIELVPLLYGQISISRVLLSGVQVFLETDSKGRANWLLPFQGGEEVSSSTSELPNFDIRKISIKDALIHFRTRKAKTTVLTVNELLINTRNSDKLSDMRLRAELNKIPFSMSGSIAPIDRLFRNEPYIIDLKTKAEDVALSVAGSIGEPLTPAALTLEFELTMPSTSVLSDIFDWDVAVFAPISVTGEIRDSDGVYLIEELKSSSGTSDIGGSIEFEFLGQRPVITAQLKSKVIDLSPFESAESSLANGKVFSVEPLPVDFIKELDVSGTLAVKQVKTSALTAELRHAALQLQGGKLNINDIDAVLSDAHVLGKINLDASGQTPRYSQSTTAKGLPLTPFLNSTDGHIAHGGTLDLDMQISGQGVSVAEIVASSNGHIQVEVSGLTLNNRGAGLASGDVILQVFDILNPLSKSDDKTVIECAVVNFPIEEGVMKSKTGLGVTTRKLNILGGGEVDLKTEKIDIGVNPKPREGIGLNLSSLASFIRLGGTIANPKPSTDTIGAASAGIKVTAAIATGGLSLLAEGLLDRASSDVDVCAIARGDVAPPSAAKTNSSSASKIKDIAGQAVETTTNVLKDAGIKAKSVFEGLFGD